MKLLFICFFLGLSTTLGAEVIDLNRNVKVEALFSTPKRILFIPIKDKKLDEKLLKILKVAKPGSSIHATMFKSDNVEMAEAFTQAQQKGVKVHIILDGIQTEKKYSKFTKVLIEGLPKENLTICQPKGCLGPKSNHNKFYLFSDTSLGRNITIQSSANLSKGHHYRFNDMTIIYSDQKLYDSYLKYWVDMSAGIKIPDYMQTINGQGLSDTEGLIKTWWSPSIDLESDPFLLTLSKTNCEKDADHRISLSHSYFKQKRAAAILTELLRLNAEGCKVEMALRADKDHNQMHEELKKAKKAGIEVSLTHYILNSGVDIHSKIILIDALVSGERKKVVFAGSSNIKDGTLLSNDETIIRFISDGLYEAYLKYFKKHLRLL